MNATSASAIILFAHGARDPQWSQPFERLQQHVAARCPTSVVRLAFLELMTPTLGDCVAQLACEGVHHLTIVPAFMARGAHLRRDLPALVDGLRQTYPNLSFTLTDALGEAEPVLVAMADWVGQVASA